MLQCKINKVQLTVQTRQELPFLSRLRRVEHGRQLADTHHCCILAHHYCNLAHLAHLYILRYCLWRRAPARAREQFQKRQGRQVSTGRGKGPLAACWWRSPARFWFRLFLAQIGACPSTTSNWLKIGSVSSFDWTLQRKDLFALSPAHSDSHLVEPSILGCTLALDFPQEGLSWDWRRTVGLLHNKQPSSPTGWEERS